MGVARLIGSSPVRYCPRRVSIMITRLEKGLSLTDEYMPDASRRNFVSGREMSLPAGHVQSIGELRG
jgi:hypothetical protein